MWLASVLDFLTSNSRRARTGRRPRTTIRKKPAPTRLTLELLEDRTVPSFLPAVNYATGLQSYSVAAADFNRDGKSDLVVENLSSNYVSVLLGNGDGTFQAARNFAPGSSFVAVGDFNNDGNPDLVLESATPDSLSVLLGNGDGTFQTPRTVATGIGPQSVAVGDFNKDGKLDIVTASPGDVLSVVLGNGDGTFQAPKTFSLPGQFPPGYTGSTPVPQTHPSLAFDSVVVGDLNNDGKLDLVVLGKTDLPTGYYSYYGTPILQTNGYVNVLLGNGDGTFATASTTLTNASELTASAVGDFNGDGKTDVVTTALDTDSAGILLGNGDGTLQAPTYVALGGTQQPESVTVADFNGDGKLDLATANHAGFDVGVLLGNGNGTFQSALTYPTPYAAESVAVGDFNGDGFPDLAVANSDPNNAANNLSILINAKDWSTPPNAAPATLLVAGFPSPTTAGVPGTFTVTAKNADGTTASGYNGTVMVNSSDYTVYSQSYSFIPADQGSHTFSVTLKTAGTQSITATDIRTPSVTGTEAGIIVKPAAASYLDLGPLDNGITAGTPFGVYVQAVDPYHNVATGYTGTVHFASSDPRAILPADYTFTAADSGNHSFVKAVTLLTSGYQTVTATDTVNGSVTGTATFLVNGGTPPATASTFGVAGFPSPTTAGRAGTFTVTAKTTSGTTASGYTGTVHFSSSDGQAGLPANYTFTAADGGVHTFIATLKTAGTQSLTITDTAAASLTGTDAGITVNPAAASQFIITGPSSVNAGVSFSLTVTVEDAYGNVVTGYTGTIHFTSSDRTATLPADYTFTAADKGVHTFTGLVLRKTGKQTLTITDTLNSALTDSVVEDVLAGPTKHK
jgi:hypothetical protein